jgi:hypothetical protein
MADRDELYGQLKGELQALSGPLFDFAEQQVRKRGAFLPFAAVLTRNRKVSLRAASSGKQTASNADILPVLHEGLREATTEHDLSAVAVCEWVKITPEGGQQTDAIKVLVEHERGLTVAFYMPCRRKPLFGWRFDGVFAKAADPEVRPRWKGDAAQR